MMNEIFWSTIVIVICSVIILFQKLWLKPQRIRSMLQKQGINGPKPSFPFGNISEMLRIHHQPPQSSNDLDKWVYSIFPYFHTWKQHYGSIYMYSTGMKQHLYVEDAALIKEMNLFRSLDLGRPSHFTESLKPMLGTSGILTNNGFKWSFQRNLISPEFFLSKIKNVVDLMEESTMEIIRKWESHIRESKGGIVEIVIEEDMKVLTADIISKTCFGTSYAQGNEIFAKLATLQATLAKPSVLFGFPNLSYFLTKEKKEIKKLEKEVEMLIMKVIHNREVENKNSTMHANEKDLLQRMIEGTTNATISDSKGKLLKLGKNEVNRMIIDMCKNIYFAGSDTTAIAVAWTLMLLTVYPEWQQSVRSEIVETFGHILPHSFNDMDKLQKLKSMTMVIQESLRLYGPGVMAAREALADVKLGQLVLPKGIILWLNLSALHRDPNNWGEDACEFKPERFADGVSKACKYPQAYVPFGLGSRICLGQNFSMIEMKIILCLLLSKFNFATSPNYQHCPVFNISLMPKYGIKLLVSKVNA
ncbi:PREDICTED: cytochrome P450 714A1-like isoform X1 [Lupinus angustifolius]|uniref:cytochrome P450 714A1-like isoform X1 n=2 Tax=Lupinus angustifolius TaxID=3871 RepID=UPI00092E2C31|nr:PREDICTED: cytochrome P450 714A1-like isoform X1 [Lupinus angustifolius]